MRWSSCSAEHCSSLAVVELPFIQQDTLSVGKTKVALPHDGYTDATHRKVIRLTRKYPWSAVHPGHRAAI